MPRLTPGPRGQPLVGCLPEIRRDPLAFLLELSENYGEVIRVPVLGTSLYLVQHPELVVEVLERGHRRFPREAMPMEALSRVLGDGLLTSEGPRWQRQRRTVQPVFRPGSMLAFVDQVTEVAETMLERWSVLARRGEPVDMAAQMRHFAFLVVGRVFFGTDLTGDMEDFAESVEELHEQMDWRIHEPSLLPLWVPTPANRAFHRHLAVLERVTQELVAAHREEPRDDVLGHLLAAQDPETGAGFTDQEVRDQTMNLLVAGHETTSNGLAWAGALLAEHPEVADHLREEAADVYGTAAPRPEDLEAMTFTRAAFLEALRLYPTAWVLFRSTREATRLGLYLLAPESPVVVSPWVCHRNPRIWPHPARYLPERHLEVPGGRALEGQGEPPRGAFLPFGLGPHACIGAELAMVEARVLFPLMLRRFRLELVGGRPPPAPRISLGPKGKVLVRLEEIQVV